MKYKIFHEIFHIKNNGIFENNCLYFPSSTFKQKNHSFIETFSKGHTVYRGPIVYTEKKINQFNCIKKAIIHHLSMQKKKHMQKAEMEKKTRGKLIHKFQLVRN